MSAQACHRIRRHLTFRVYRCCQRINVRRTLEILLLAQVKEHVYTADRDMHSIERKSCGIGKQMYTLRMHSLMSDWWVSNMRIQPLT